ncbi:MAG: hypothetical protein HY391_06035 [Deltaproteobacteria bacterium]|nr:hypothetical protein [Deltaproteobacteria bacterium]
MKPIKPRLKLFFRYLGAILSENISYKITALLVTFGLFYYVAGEQHIEVNKVVPIVFRLPDKLAIANEVLPNVEIRISGPKASVQEVLPRTDVITLDLTSARPGYASYRIHSGLIQLPRDVKVTSISPSVITPRLELKLKKVVKVKAQLLGKLEKGLTLKEVTVTPDEIEVAGPQSLLDPLDLVKTLPIDLSEVRGAGEKEVRVEESFPVPLTFNPDLVKVYLNILEETELRIFPSIPIQAKTDFRYVIAPHSVRVTLRAPASVAAALKMSDIEAFVDLEHKSPGEYSERVELKSPEKVTVVSIAPPVVKVTLWK